jgi:hypothetical protein
VTPIDLAIAPGTTGADARDIDAPGIALRRLIG